MKSPIYLFEWLKLFLNDFKQKCFRCYERKKLNLGFDLQSLFKKIKFVIKGTKRIGLIRTV